MLLSAPLLTRTGARRCARALQSHQCAPARPTRFSASTHSHGRRYSTASTPAASTPLEKIILDTIKATGPISFSTYMSLCLAHPTEGYYMKEGNQVFGSKGDFVTSPEISQVFGELIGIWFLSVYAKAAQGKPVRLVELGPGRGTLLADMIRVFEQVPDAKGTLSHVCLVETSTKLRAEQRRNIVPPTGARWTVEVYDSIEDIPPDEDVYAMIVAHEFFDALPFNVLEKTQQGWCEVMITSAPDPAAPLILKPATPSSPSTSAPSAAAPALRRAVSRSPTPTSQLLASSSPRFAALPVGTRLEVSPTAFKTARRIAETLSTEAGGSALIVDYGGERAYGDSFRAFKDHKLVDVFHRPGECDLTANVDFAYLKEAMAGTRGSPHGPLSQADFLERMGLGLRVAALQRAAASDERRGAIGSAARRLADRTGMGREYRFLGVTGAPRAEDAKEEGVWPFMSL